MLGEHLLGASKVVVIKLCSQLFNCFRDTATHWRCANKPVIDGKERMAGAHCNDVSTGIRTGKFYSAINGIRTILAELDHVSAVDETEKLLGALQLDSGRPSKICPKLQLRSNCIKNGLKCMAKGYGS